jgi:hypothetical protein
MENCRFEDKINETHKIVTGNGNPESGLGRQVALINERQQGVLKTLETIDEKLKDVNINYNVLLGEITRVGTNLSAFESSVNGKETVRSNMIKTALVVIGFAITIGIAVWTHVTTQENGYVIKKVKSNQDTVKLDLKKSEARGDVLLPKDEVFDIKKHAAFADSILNTLKK